VLMMLWISSWSWRQSMVWFRVQSTFSSVMNRHFWHVL
jgi:hypothetical protein